MAFTIAMDRPLGDELRNIALELAERSLLELDNAETDLHDAVHQVRKHGKKLRALLRLVRTAVPGLYRRENTLVRDVARELSHLRDRGALLETVAALENEAVTEDERAALAVLRPRLEREAAAAHEHAPAVIANARHAFTELARRVPDWPLGDLEPHDLFEGAARTYRSGRKALARARAHGDDAALHHAWRKQVKYGAHHWLLLQQLWPTVIRALHAEMDMLADDLGDHHNLAVLAQALGDLALPSADEDTLRALVARRQHALHVATVSVGERLYYDTPRAHRNYLTALHEVAAHTD